MISSNEEDIILDHITHHSLVGSETDDHSHHSYEQLIQTPEPEPEDDDNVEAENDPTVDDDDDVIPLSNTSKSYSQLYEYESSNIPTKSNEIESHPTTPNKTVWTKEATQIVMDHYRRHFIDSQFALATSMQKKDSNLLSLTESNVKRSNISWDIVARAIEEKLGQHYSGEQCRQKWKTLYRSYKEVTQKKRTPPKSLFFYEIDEFLNSEKLVKKYPALNILTQYKIVKNYENGTYEMGDQFYSDENSLNANLMVQNRNQENDSLSPSKRSKWINENKSKTNIRMNDQIQQSYPSSEKSSLETHHIKVQETDSLSSKSQSISVSAPMSSNGGFKTNYVFKNWTYTAPGGHTSNSHTSSSSLQYIPAGQQDKPSLNPIHPAQGFYWAAAGHGRSTSNSNPSNIPYTPSSTSVNSLSIMISHIDALNANLYHFMNHIYGRLDNLQSSYQVLLHQQNEILTYFNQFKGKSDSLAHLSAPNSFGVSLEDDENK